MKKVITQAELGEIAKDLLGSLKVGQNRATTIFLNGNLGAGKTTLTQLIGQNLGVEESIISPTYVILKKYELPTGQKWQNLFHLDLYRLDNERDAQILGLDKIFGDKDNLVIIEWPKQIPDLGIKPDVEINLEHQSDNERLIEIIYDSQ